MKYLSLFSGIGGFELGIQQAYENIQKLRATNTGQPKGSQTGNQDGRGEQLPKLGMEGLACVGFSEIDKYAIDIYQKHFPNHKNYGDITKIKAEDLPEFDLIVGGFPCQSFSIAGKRRGFNDTRGTLFFDIARIIKAKQPSLLLLENVKGLLSHDKGDTFRVIVTTLDELGYDLQWQVLNSKNFGVPQNRERVFIVGHIRGTSRPQVFPFGKDDSGIDEGEQSISRKIRSVGQGRNKPDLNNEILENGENRPLRIRRLTPIECERLQGFPDGWTEGISDTQRYKCLGNAVTTNVIQAIMEKLMVEYLKKEKII